jgi:periplasmic protein TonB
MTLQKKCLTASAIAHGLLVLLVFVGSAFIPQKPKIEGPVFEIVDIPLDALVEEPNVISGNPNAGRPPATAPLRQPEAIQPQVVTPPPQPIVKPEPQKLPEPVKDTPRPVEPQKITRPEPESNPFDISKAKTIKASPKPEKTEPSFDLSQAKKQTIKTTPQQTQSTDSRAAENAKEAARLAQVLEGVKKTVQQGTGSRVGISYSDIIGPGGRAQMSYDLAVAKIYESEFKKKSIATRGNEPAVEVEVTVRRDGAVMGERITKRSGRAQFDRAVQDVLNTVKRNKVIPFPADFKSDTRTIRINFNLDDSLNNG